MTSHERLVARTRNRGGDTSRACGAREEMAQGRVLSLGRPRMTPSTMDAMAQMLLTSAVGVESLGQSRQTGYFSTHS